MTQQTGNLEKYFLNQAIQFGQGAHLALRSCDNSTEKPPARMSAFLRDRESPCGRFQSQ